MSYIFITKFPKIEANPTETQWNHKVNSAVPKAQFSLCALAAEYEQPSHFKQEAVPCHTVNDK